MWLMPLSTICAWRAAGRYHRQQDGAQRKEPPFTTSRGMRIAGRMTSGSALRAICTTARQILLGASFATARVRSVSPNLSEDADDAVHEALSPIEEIERESRTLAHLLPSPLRNEMALPMAVRWYANGLAPRAAPRSVSKYRPS